MSPRAPAAISRGGARCSPAAPAGPGPAPEPPPSGARRQLGPWRPQGPDLLSRRPSATSDRPGTAGSRSANAGGDREPGRDSRIPPWRASTRRPFTKHLDELPFSWLAGEAVPFIRSVDPAGKKSGLPFRHVNAYSRSAFWETPQNLLPFIAHKSQHVKEFHISQTFLFLVIQFLFLHVPHIYSYSVLLFPVLHFSYIFKTKT